MQIIARDGRTLRVNRAWLELWGVSKDMLADYVYGSYNIFEDAYLESQGITEMIRRAFDGEFFTLPPVRYDPAEIGRPGRARWVQGYVYPIKNEDDAIEEIVLIHDDITEERHAEMTLRFLAETSRSLLASAVEYEETLTKVADLAREQLGGWCAIHVLEATGSRLAAVSHRDPEKAQLLWRLWRDVRALDELDYGPARVLRTGEAELRREFPDILASHDQPAAPQELGGVTVKSFLSVPMRQRGEVIGTLTSLSADAFFSDEDRALAQELADRAALALQNARLYQDAQHAIAARDEFLSVASHELRTPLASLQLAVQGLRDGVVPATPENVGRAFELAERQVVRLGRLVGELLEVGRIQSNRLGLDLEEVDLVDLVRDVGASFAPDLAQAECTLDIRADGPVVGWWDRDKLEQVIVNLLSNATKFGSGGPIEITVEDGNMARLTVTDHGVGIDPDRIDTIFKKFDRAVSTIRTMGRGR